MGIKLAKALLPILVTGNPLYVLGIVIAPTEQLPCAMEYETPSGFKLYCNAICLIYTLIC
jgi:hypothetical protein